MAVTLSQLLTPSQINLQLQSTRRTAAIHEVARQLEPNAEVLNFGAFYSELLARERLDTTYIGHDTAVPHARTDHVRRIVVAVGRSDTGIVFENGDKRVKLLFVIGTPKGAPGDYLQTVGALCRLVRDPAAREQLLAAESPEAFLDALAAGESASA